MAVNLGSTFKELIDEINSKGSGATIDSINGLKGGTLTSPLTFNGGDAATASKAILSESGQGQITDSSTATLLGFNSAKEFLVGSNNYKTVIRGNANSTIGGKKFSDLAVKSDIPSTSSFAKLGASDSNLFNSNNTFSLTILAQNGINTYYQGISTNAVLYAGHGIQATSGSNTRLFTFPTTGGVIATSSDLLTLKGEIPGKVEETLTGYLMDNTVNQVIYWDADNEEFTSRDVTELETKVVGNPTSGEAVGTLSRLQIGDKVYSVVAVTDYCVKLTTDQTISGVKTFNAPTNVSGSETTTTKFKTSNGGAVIIGKEGANSGTMLRLDQVDGTCRLRFGSSATAGAMVWEQPEKNASLYFDLGNAAGTGKNRVTMPNATGTLALTSQLPAAVSANPTLSGSETELTGLKIGSTSYKLPSGGGGDVTAAGDNTFTGNNTFKKPVSVEEEAGTASYKGNAIAVKNSSMEAAIDVSLPTPTEDGDTFALKSEIPTDYVKLSGSQTINGAKTFGSFSRFKAGIDLYGTLSMYESTSSFAKRTDYKYNVITSYVPKINTTNTYTSYKINFPTSVSSAIAINLPAKDGTIALTSDIDTAIGNINTLLTSLNSGTGV